MTTKELFDFVTDLTITEENMDEYLEKIKEKIANRPATLSNLEQVDEEVFKNSFIPRTLDEVIDIERDMTKAGKGQSDGILYQTVTGLKSDLSGAQRVPTLLENTTHENMVPTVEDEQSSSDEESSSESEDEERSATEQQAMTSNGEDSSSLSKKEQKKLVKEQQREKRKTKTPKYIKKLKKKPSKDKAKGKSAKKKN